MTKIKSKRKRWQDPPHHESHDDEVCSIPDNPFGYLPVFHKNCGGEMTLVKLYVDSFLDDTRSRDFSRPDSIGVSRVVLGVKCKKCGYASCLKLTLYDTRVFTLEGVQPTLERERGRGKYPAISEQKRAFLRTDRELKKALKELARARTETYR